MMHSHYFAINFSRHEPTALEPVSTMWTTSHTAFFAAALAAPTDGSVSAEMAYPAVLVTGTNLVPNPDFAVAGGGSTGAASWGESSARSMYHRTIMADGRTAMKWNSSLDPGVYATCHASIPITNIVPGNGYFFSAEVQSDGASGVSVHHLPLATRHPLATHHLRP
jgi:hypothetical protein